MKQCKNKNFEVNDLEKQRYEYDSIKIERPKVWRYICGAIGIIINAYVSLVMFEMTVVLAFLGVYIVFLSLTMGCSIGYLIAYYTQKKAKEKQFNGKKTMKIILIIYQLVFSMIPILFSMLNHRGDIMCCAGDSSNSLQVTNFFSAFLISSIVVALLNITTYLNAFSSYNFFVKKQRGSN